MVKILIKKLSSNITLPVYETKGSSGLDIIANNSDIIKIEPNEWKIIPTGISIAIPKNYEIQIRPRSGLSAKQGISVLNTPGTIDSDYRGEIKVILINLGKKTFLVSGGDRIAQMVLCPIVYAELEEVDKLPDSKRGEGGFGSTGIWLFYELYK